MSEPEDLLRIRDLLADPPPPRTPAKAAEGWSASEKLGEPASPTLPQVIVETGGSREEPSAGLPFDPRLLLLGLWRRRLQIAAIAAVVAGIAFVVALLSRSHEWEVWVTILRKREQKEFLVTASNPIVKLQVYSMPTVLRLVKVHENLQAVIDQLDLDVDTAALSRRVRVDNPKDTDLVEILVTWEDPSRAVEIANALARAFVDNVDRLQKLEAIQAYDYLSKQLADARERDRAISQQLVEFKARHGVVKLSDQAGKLIEKLSEFDALAEKERLDAGMAADGLAITRRELARQDDTVVSSIFVKKPLETKLLELQTRLADLLSVYTDESAQVKEARDEIARVEELVRQGLEEQLYERTVSRNPVLSVLEQALVEKTVESASREARARGYATVRDRYRAELLELPEVEAELARLQQNFDTLDEVEKTLASRVEEVRIIRDSTAANFSIMQEARIPEYPLPSPAKWIALAGLVVGIGAGFAFALSRELLDTRLKGLGEAERAVGVEPLGEVPLLSGERAPLIGDADPALESIRALLTRLMLLRRGSGGWRLMLTGAAHLEGRTTLALNLARAATSRGLRVCVVDAQPRKPSLDALAGRLGLRRGGPGVADLLNRRTTLEEAVERPDPAGPSYLRAGRGWNAEELGGSSMRALMEELAARFDLVLVDGPPVLVGSDALLLAPAMDAVVLVAAAFGEPRAAHAEAASRLEAARVPILGLILNRVPEAYRSPYFSGRISPQERSRA